MDHGTVPVHGGPAGGARPELTGARAAGRYGSLVVAASGRGGGERRRDADLVLTGGRGAPELAGGEREQAAAVAIGVARLGARIGGKERRGERGVERRRRGAFYRAGRRWRGGEEADGGGKLIPVGFE